MIDDADEEEVSDGDVGDDDDYDGGNHNSGDAIIKNHL